jgi:MFS family permease
MTNGMTPARQHEASIPVSGRPGARVAIFLLLSINLFNYLDRYVLAAVEPEIRKELLPSKDPEDQTANFKTGLLSSAFFVTYSIIAPIFGWLGDRMSRWKLIGIGVILWSLASGASGLEWSLGLPQGFLNWIGLSEAFFLLLLTRCFVGVGEGAYGPVAPTVISDLYPVEKRGRMMAWFYMAIPVGSALGYILGGQIAETALKWRGAFYLVVPPGILLGLWCFFMREPSRGQAEVTPVASDRVAGMKEYLSLLKIPSYVINTVGMMAMTFAMGGLAFHMKEYLKQAQAEPLWGVQPISIFGMITVVTGLTATLTGGIVGDKLRSRFSGSYFLVSGITMIVGFFMILLVLWTPFPMAWVFVFLAVFCLFFNTGPTNTILANVTHPSVRATAFAVNIFAIHAGGDIISPPIIGWIGKTSMRDGFLVVSFMMLLSGVIWIWGARYLKRDTELAPTRLNGN